MMRKMIAVFAVVALFGGGLVFAQDTGADEEIPEGGEVTLLTVHSSKGLEYPAYLPQTNPGYPWALAG